MALPPVTFIVPVYSVKGDYLSPCLDSILTVASKYGSAEILVLNDQSPDNSAEVIARYVKTYPQFIREIPSDRHLGQSAARAKMIEEARGKYVIPCDHDDVLFDFDLARSVAFLEHHQEYFGSYARKYYFSERGYENRADGGTNSLFRMLIAPKLIINTAILRRDDVLAAGNFTPPDADRPEALEEDLFLLARMSLSKTFFFERLRPRCLYRLHPTQITQRKAAELAYAHHHILNYFLNQYKDTAELILQGQLPAITPENDHLVMILLGAIASSHLENFQYAANCCRTAIKIHPDDYGAWLLLLRLAAAHHDDNLWRTAFVEAQERFSDDPFIQLELSFSWIEFYRLHGQPVPQEVSLYSNDLYARHIFLPPSLAAHPLMRGRENFL